MGAGHKFVVKCQTGGIDHGLSSHSYDQVLRLTLECENLGYDGVVLTDHLFLSGRPYPECWSTLSALAAETGRIMLGPYVTVYLYRAQTLLARMAATFDHLSGGRLLFYIGAGGWGQMRECPPYGIPHPQAAERIAGLREAIATIRKTWSPKWRDYDQENWSRQFIAPLQPNLPIWVGGSGSLLLKVVAEAADGWDTGFCTLEGYDRMCEKVKEFCGAVGRRFGQIRRSFNCETIIIGQNEEDLKRLEEAYLPAIVRNKELHPTKRIRQLPLEEYLARRVPFRGKPDECLREIEQYTTRGVESFILHFPDLPELSSLRLFAREVAAKL